MGEIPPGAAADHLGLERAMKALVLALRLRVEGPAMAHGNPQAQQPDAEAGPGLIGAVAPGRAVVHQHALGQPVAAKDPGQDSLNRHGAFVGAGRHSQGEARMVVEHGQRVAAPGGHREMPLVVHLPQLVGRGALEPPEGLVPGAFLGIDQPMAMQDRRDGAGARHPALAKLGQTPLQLAPAPAWMLQAQPDHLGLHRRRRAPGRAVRARGAIRQPRFALRRIPTQPFVADPRPNAVPPEQRLLVRPGLTRQQHKLSSRRHDGPLLPRHRSPPSRDTQCQENVFTMSPNTRSP
jgi:hypothetical protein